MASRRRFGVAGGVACALLTLAVVPAKAQNLFQELFGSIARVFTALHRGDPMDTLARAPDGIVSARQDTGPARAFCVRTCDGHFFPVEAHGRVTAAGACQSACPAADTRLYSGSNIDFAMARDGSRYADLPTAFLFRKQLVDGCTCNGRTAFGLVPASPEDDPTLRPGDVVATKNGLMAVTGSGQFAPAASYAGFSPRERARFSQMKITPQNGSAPAATASVRPQIDEKSAALSR
jgi:uncharacterized protein DUF2865